MMNSEKGHYVTRKFQDFQRQSTRSHTCSLCDDGLVFQSEQRLWDHATTTHPEVSWDSRDSQAWKDWLPGTVINKSKQKGGSRLHPSAPAGLSKPSSDDSMKLNIGDDGQSPSRPGSTPGRSEPIEKRISDIDKLSLEHRPDTSLESNPNPMGDGSFLTSVNPLKRAAVGESELADHPIDSPEDNGLPRSRRAKALSGGPFVSKDPDFDRKAVPMQESEHPRDRPTSSKKQLFDPTTDGTTLNAGARILNKPDTTISSQRVYDPRARVFRSKREPTEEKDREAPRQKQPVIRGKTTNLEQPSQDDPSSSQSDQENWVEPEPKLLLQPETRPISHDQLVVEVKGIYAGLVMVEAKCIDVDDKQSAAAQERNLLYRTQLTLEQWQALIALHKTLLHEHHDFFLASQHPSATPALSRLAAKYSMPARMWRHGIHAFLEVLRHRLPESLDHMLAFIYIAYSMMALLYETVPTFEDTWIECLGDLGRYRMAIEDDDIRDREVWSGVARFWYGKAADKSPNVGRLYHHLAILARPYTLQQLSLYLHALTCILPFESARGSIMTLFNPILEGRESAYHRSSSMETIFIKAHGSLFTGRSLEDFVLCTRKLCDGGLLDNHISRVTAKFKEQGVFAALSNIASLFEYGVLRAKDIPRSIFRLAFDEAISHKSSESQAIPENTTNVRDSGVTSPQALTSKLLVSDLTPQEFDSSLSTIAYASNITFRTLSVVLQRIGDRNVHPMINTYLTFLHSLIDIRKAMQHIEMDVPWLELASFLTALAKPEAMTSKVFSSSFPKPDQGVGRPLPEDFIMRGHVWIQGFFPITWFEDAMVDDEERSLELPSMAAPRRERLLWLGHNIASRNQWIRYESSTRTFFITPYAKELRKREMQEALESSQSTQYSTQNDTLMSGIEESEINSLHSAESPSQQRSPTPESTTSDLPPPHDGQTLIGKMDDRSRSPQMKSPNVLPRKILTKADEEYPQTANPKLENFSLRQKDMNPDSEAWLKGETHTPGTTPQKSDNENYASDPRKLEFITRLESPEHQDPTIV